MSCLYGVVHAAIDREQSARDRVNAHRFPIDVHLVANVEAGDRGELHRGLIRVDRARERRGRGSRGKGEERAQRQSAENSESFHIGGFLCRFRLFYLLRLIGLLLAHRHLMLALGILHCGLVLLIGA